jgi:hypothetical protein
MLAWTGVASALLVLADGGYGSLRSQAEAVKNLGRFLEGYLGDCLSDDPEFDRRGCEAKARDVQKEIGAKLLKIELEDVAEQLRLANWDDRRGAYLLHFTPFFAERGLALSIGKPSGLNKDGQPIVKNMPLWVPLPKGEAEFSFRRQLERGSVRLEMLFKPNRVWALQAKKTDPPVRGVSVDLVGLRLYSGRGDEVIAEQVYR